MMSNRIINPLYHYISLYSKRTCLRTHAKTIDKRLIFKTKLIFILVAKATKIKIAEVLEYQWFVKRLAVSF